MLVYGNLERAALDLLGADPSTAGDKFVARVWYNTATNLAKYWDGTAIRTIVNTDLGQTITNKTLTGTDNTFSAISYASLAATASITTGTHATASNNVKQFRAAPGVLQFITADTVPVEGALETALAQLSFKFENYTNAGKPAAGRSGRVAYITDLGLLQYDNGVIWQSFAGGVEGVASGGMSTPALPYTILSTDSGKVFKVDTSSAAGAVTLPTAVAGFKFTIKDIGGAMSTNALTVTRAAAESIENRAASYLCEVDYASWTFQCDGTNWWVIA